jgi:cell division protein FtsB
MLSYFFTKKSVEEPVLEKTDAEKNVLVIENEQLKTQIETLLAEKAKLEKQVEHLKRESSVYRDLMFTKVCTCNN